MPPAAQRRAKPRKPRTPTNDPTALTRRERVVLAEMARGFANPAIAERLCMSRSTLTHHVSHIFAKLGVTNRTHAVLAAISRGWIDPSGKWIAPNEDPACGRAPRDSAEQIRLPIWEDE